MLSSASHARIYSGERKKKRKNLVTSFDFSAHSSKRRHGCIKTKTIKRYSNLFSCPFFKNTKRGSSEMLMLMLMHAQELKP